MEDASRIWILKLDGLSHQEIPKPAEGCNDTDPMWIGDVVYFLSDRRMANLIYILQI